MALYGDNLAKAVRPGTTWQQATDLLGTLEDGIRQCYASLSLWDNWHSGKGLADTLNLAVLSAIVPEDAEQVKPQLDDELAGLYAFDTIVQEQGAAEGWDAAIGDDYLSVLQSKVKTSSSAIALCDSLFHTSVIQQVSDQIVPAVGDLADKISLTISKFLGNLIAGLWPYLLVVCLVLYFVFIKPARAKA